MSMHDPKHINEDLTRYCKAMTQVGGVDTCLAIERRYGLDGYPPSIVTQILSAGARGEDMVAAEDKAIGGGEE